MGQSIKVFYYLLDKIHPELTVKVRKNTVAIQLHLAELDKFDQIIKQIENQANYYFLKTNKRGKGEDYNMYCIDISDYEPHEIDQLFSKLRELAVLRKEIHFEVLD